MFLITTADQRFWKTDEPVLFLGEWCKLFSQRSMWETMDYAVLPYHWADRKRLYQDYSYLDDLYESILPELSRNLNRIHGTNHSIRYWRIIVGLWLLSFIHVLYDRYQSILSAAEYTEVENALIIRSDITRYVPQDFGAFGIWATEDDEYNHYIYSRIIEDLGRIPFEYVDVERGDSSYINGGSNVRTRASLFRKAAKNVLQYVPQRFNSIVLIQTYLSTRDTIRLYLALAQVPYLLSPRRKTPESEIDLRLRGEIHLRSADGEFEELLMRMITEQIPTLYVEGYSSMNQISLKMYPKRPKVIFNGVAFNANEAFKFWAAHNVDRDVKLLGNQHGGLYGSGLVLAVEDHQIRISDTFYTWGWRSDSYENTKPLAAAKFNTVKREVCSKEGGRLLLVEMGMPRYSFATEMLCVSSSGFLAYLDEQYRFVDALSKRNKELLLVRLYVHDYGWNQKDRWTSEFPEIECSDGISQSIITQLNMSRVIICTYNGTTYLESFVANFPTILFWTAERWEIRKSARPYFDALRKVGILHSTPEQAADKVNEISEDPISWWAQSDIQEAKDQFCLQFARTHDDWLEEWKRELRCR